MTPAPRPRRISLFLPALAGGGAERVFLDLAGGLAEFGHDVSLVIGGDRGELDDRPPPPGVHLVRLSRPRTLYVLPALIRHLRQRRPHVLFSTIDHANVLSIVAAGVARSDTRVVVRVANNTSEAMKVASRKDRVTFAIARWLYPLASHIVAPSEGVAADTWHFVRGRANMRIIRNPVVDETFPARMAAEPDHPWFRSDGPPIVLGVGRLHAQKDFPTLIDAVASARQRRPMRLLILGEGAERDALMAHAAARGFTPGVDFDLPGFVPDVLPYMHRCGVFVLSSTHEGAPGVLVQALSIGAALVATDCQSGPREILLDGEYGLLVDVGHSDQMADAIERALAEGPRPRPRESWEMFSRAFSLREYQWLIDEVVGGDR